MAESTINWDAPVYHANLFEVEVLYKHGDYHLVTWGTKEIAFLCNKFTGEILDHRNQSKTFGTVKNRPLTLAEKFDDYRRNSGICITPKEIADLVRIAEAHAS